MWDWGSKSNTMDSNLIQLILNRQLMLTFYLGEWVGFGGTSNSAQGLLLALSSGIFPGRAWRRVRSGRYHTQHLISLWLLLLTSKELLSVPKVRLQIVEEHGSDMRDILVFSFMLISEKIQRRPWLESPHESMAWVSSLLKQVRTLEYYGAQGLFLALNSGITGGSKRTMCDAGVKWELAICRARVSIALSFWSLLAHLNLPFSSYCWIRVLSPILQPQHHSHPKRILKSFSCENLCCI